MLWKKEKSNVYVTQATAINVNYLNMKKETLRALSSTSLRVTTVLILGEETSSSFMCSPEFFAG